MKKTLHILLTLLALLGSSASLSAQSIQNAYADVLDSLQSAYNIAVGTRSEEIPLKASQLSSNASDYQEGMHIEYMLDGNPSTYWHSDWHGQVTAKHYIQIEMTEPVSGCLGLYVMRRQTAENHAVKMGLWGSTDAKSWTLVGYWQLGNAVSGQAATSNPLSLKGASYSHLRLTIEQTTSGRIFSHFAEIRLLQMQVFGPSFEIDMPDLMKEAQAMLKTAQQKVDNSWATERDLNDLIAFRTRFVNELNRLRAGEVPSFVKRKTDLPSLYVNTYGNSPITSKENYILAKLWRLSDNGVEVYDSLEIRGRGNSTWGLQKKPYRIKFAHKEKFLGKGRANARNWTLMANHVDNTLIHNTTASYIGELLGQPFVPGSQFVDLTLNGEYVGNYQISDHMQVHKKRVDIYEQEEEASDTSNITGGYLLQLEGQAGNEPVHFYSTVRNKLIAVKSPDPDVINEAQKSYIINYVNNFEKILYSSNYKDSIKGYRPLVDSLTLASWFLAEEFTANPDGYFSIYFYKEKDDPRLYWGPLWDFDIAFNNCYRKGDVTNNLMIDAGYGGTDWPKRFYSDPWFQNLVGRQWHRAVADGLVYKTLAYVDSMAQVLEQSQQLNFQKWSITERTWDERVLYSTYAEGIEAMKTFIREHALFLSDYFPNPEGVLPPIDPAADPLHVDSRYAYYIYNVGVDHPIDINDAGNVCTWALDGQRAASQQWRIIPVTGDYYRIVSIDSKLAITDAAPLAQDGTYNRGTQLRLQEVDEQSDRQLWRFVPTAGNYVIDNKQTKLAWNNSNGGTDNGCPVISWTNNSDNASKTTRQWRVEQGDLLPEDEDAIAMVEKDVEYKVVYSPSTQEVNIRIPLTSKNRQGTIQLYDLQGHMLATGTPNQAICMSGLPNGVYLLRWNIQGHSRAVKFCKE